MADDSLKGISVYDSILKLRSALHQKSSVRMSAGYKTVTQQPQHVWKSKV